MKDIDRIEGKADDINDIAESHNREKTYIENAQISIIDWVLGYVDPPCEEIKYTGKRATEVEIKNCIELLKKHREDVPQFSYFGDANWQATDSQVAILEWILKDGK